MRKWYLSYAIHLGVWAVLIYLALYVEAIGLTLPMIIILSALGLAYLVLSVSGLVLRYVHFYLLGGPEDVYIDATRPSYFVPWSEHAILAGVLAVLWLAIGIFRARKGKRAMLLSMPHGVIFASGVWATYTRGSAIFSMQW